MPKANAQGLEVKVPQVRPRTRSGDATREGLLAAAAAAIATSGWSAVTTRQVAALAGVNQALVHYHFGSMERLRREAVLAALASEVEVPMQALIDERPLEDGIAACLEAVARIDLSSDTTRLLFEAMLGAGRDAELRTALAAAYQQFRAVLANRVRRAGGADPEAASMVITAALDGLLLHRLVSPDLELAGLTDTLVGMLRASRAAE